jgi:excisionase family DNA binding protein
MQTFEDIRAMLRAVGSAIQIRNVLTPGEVMVRLGVRRQKVDDLLARGHIRGWRAGRTVWIDRASVDAYERDRGSPATER